MEVLSIKKQPNGSAIVELEMTESEQNVFTEIGIIYILKEKVKEMKENGREKS